MFDKILIANRGEIALRVLRACKELGIPTVAVHSTADEDAMHVRLADESVCIGPPPAKDSYLNIPALLAACEITGADAVHPGYGFLSENARFAVILGEHNVHFIGPRPEHIRLMGDKIAAKRAALALGIPIVPGSDGGITSDAEAFRLARDIGFPLMLKAAAGGGGRGMKVIRAEDEMAAGLVVARAEAQAAFGDDTVYLEKYLARPRHVEIQVLGDGKGRAIHLGERDCSLQRRHQKVWEEGPSPALNTAVRDQIGETVAKAMRDIKYLGAGTVEFLYEDGKFNFIEMNTRIQVEHPVTELVTGVDLVRTQIEIAAGGKLPFKQKDLAQRGWAIECRIYAEDPAAGFVPAPGKIETLRFPDGPGVRNDAGVYAGAEVPVFYDPMISKLAVWGANRGEAIDRMRRALGEFVISGELRTNLDFHRWIMTHPRFLKGDFDTNFIKEEYHPNQNGAAPSGAELAAIFLAAIAAQKNANHSNGAGAQQPVPAPSASAWRMLGRLDMLRR